jgi:hypothetical protein
MAEYIACLCDLNNQIGGAITPIDVLILPEKKERGHTVPERFGPKALNASQSRTLLL